MVTQLSAQAIRAMRDPARLAALITPDVRAHLRSALNSEYSLAAAMPDDVFWGYDAAWKTLGATTLEDVRREGIAGGGGRNMTWNNNQFWMIGQQCSQTLFSMILYQQRRYIAAQIRLREHLARVPQWQVADGLDAMAGVTGGDVRRACGGVHPKDAAEAWAMWCEHALALIGVARWASNFTWSDTSKTCGDITYRLDAQPTVGAYDTGCRYVPDCASDAYGVTRLGYVAGRATNGVLRWEAAADAVRHPKMTAALVAAAQAGWQIRWDRRRDEALKRSGTSVPFNFSDLPFSIAPRALGLHSSSRSPGTPQIPENAGAFSAGWSPGVFVDYPPFLEKPTGWAGNASVGDWLYAYFLEHPTGAPGFAEQRAQREKTGCWYWKYAPIDTGGGASGIATNQAHPVPASEWLIWNIIAKARDIVAMPFGDMIIQGFGNLERAIGGIPPEFRGSLDDVASAVRAAANTVRMEQGAVVGGAFAAAAGAGAAINPVVGIVIGILGTLTAALVSFSVEIGWARSTNPPALQFPALRVAPPSVQGDDRCWINPGAGESLNAYDARVAAPYAEAARRTGGDPAAMFDEIARIRTEQYCAANPADPRCQLQPAAVPWLKYIVGAAGAVGGAYAARAFILR